MRSFLSLDLPHESRNALFALAAGVRVGRQVSHENLHVTLSFLGDQADDRLEDLHDALSLFNAPRFFLRPLGLELLGHGNAAAPRTLVLTIRPDPGLMSLQAEMDKLARRANMKPERRRFHPHVTLARFRKGLSPHEIEALHGFLAAHPGHDLSPIPATSVSLVASSLRPEGARYETLAIYPLS